MGGSSVLCHEGTGRVRRVGRALLAPMAVEARGLGRLTPFGSWKMSHPDSATSYAGTRVTLFQPSFLALKNGNLHSNLPGLMLINDWHSPNSDILPLREVGRPLIPDAGGGPFGPHWLLGQIRSTRLGGQPPAPPHTGLSSLDLPRPTQFKESQRGHMTKASC